MNPGDTITTTEINTEIKIEVQLETASIVKVETMKGQSNTIEKADSFNKTAVESPLSANQQKSEAEKTRDQIKAAREAKKLAKQAKKQKSNVVSGADVTSIKDNGSLSQTLVKTELVENNRTLEAADNSEKSRKQIKQIGDNMLTAITDQLNKVHINDNTSKETTVANTNAERSGEEKKKPALTKAERRALQEKQRAAKADAKPVKTKQTNSKLNTVTTGAAPANNTSKTSIKTTSAPTIKEQNSVKRSGSSSPAKTVRFNDGNVKLFSHLEKPLTDANLFINNTHIHPGMARLGEQYAKRTVVGSNARCIAFLNAIKMVIQDFETPPKKEFSRSLETFITNCVDYLQKCRTLAVSVINAHKSLIQVLMQLPKEAPESELKERLFTFIDTYIENQIGKAAQAINSVMQKKINNGDVILTFGCSSLINYICEEAQARKVDFRVIVVDSRPFCEGQELLRRLTAKEIPCTYVLINAVSFVMPEVTKVLLGAHALLANGYVMSRAGTAQVALVARSFNVPVLVCCETHKFSERFQTDAIVYNELGNPDDIVVDDKCCLSNWQAKYKMSPLNLNYDITPPELVTAVVTEVSVLPCTSVPVILRMKPDWLV